MGQKDPNAVLITVKLNIFFKQEMGLSLPPSCMLAVVLGLTDLFSQTLDIYTVYQTNLLKIFTIYYSKKSGLMYYLTQQDFFTIFRFKKNWLLLSNLVANSSQIFLASERCSSENRQKIERREHETKKRALQNCHS